MQLIVQKRDPVDISVLDEYLNIKDLEVFLDKNLIPESFGGLILYCNDQGLSLGYPGNSAASPTRVDFSAPSLQYRLTTSKRSEGLLKAIGLDKYSLPISIVDATAGLGSDAYIMAAMGCQVTMVEQSGIIAALLNDGLSRARDAADSTLKTHLQRLSLEFSNSHDYLAKIQESGDKPDVIYLDPMFPPRLKTAKVKKDMALMQQLLPVNGDVIILLEKAIKCADKRVVLKRPGKITKKGLNNESPNPDFQVRNHFRINFRNCISAWRLGGIN